MPWSLWLLDSNQAFCLYGYWVRALVHGLVLDLIARIIICFWAKYLFYYTNFEPFKMNISIIGQKFFKFSLKFGLRKFTV